MAVGEVGKSVGSVIDADVFNNFYKKWNFEGLIRL